MQRSLALKDAFMRLVQEGCYLRFKARQTALYRLPQPRVKWRTQTPATFYIKAFHEFCQRYQVLHACRKIAAARVHETLR